MREKRKFPHHYVERHTEAHENIISLIVGYIWCSCCCWRYILWPFLALSALYFCFVRSGCTMRLMDHALLCKVLEFFTFIHKFYVFLIWTKLMLAIVYISVGWIFSSSSFGCLLHFTIYGAHTHTGTYESWLCAYSPSSKPNRPSTESNRMKKKRSEAKPKERKNHSESGQYNKLSAIVFSMCIYIVFFRWFHFFDEVFT